MNTMEEHYRPRTFVPLALAPAIVRPDLLGSFDAYLTGIDFSIYSPPVKPVEQGVKRTATTAVKQRKDVKLSRPTTRSCPTVLVPALVPVFVRNGAKRLRMRRMSGHLFHQIAQMHPIEEINFLVAHAKATLRDYFKENPSIDPHPPMSKRDADNILLVRRTPRELHSDVKFLLGFPGSMGKFRAASLLARRHFPELDPVGEVSSESLVMPDDQPSSATLTSELNRVTRLNNAVAKQRQASPVPLPKIEEAEPFEANVSGRFHLPSFYDETTYDHTTSGLDADQTVSVAQAQTTAPATPERQVAPAHNSASDVVDVDLNKQPDIFASAVMKKRFTSTTVEPAPQLDFTTPRRGSPSPPIRLEASLGPANFSPIEESTVAHQNVATPSYGSPSAISRLEATLDAAEFSPIEESTRSPSPPEAEVNGSGDISPGHIRNSIEEMFFAPTNPHGSPKEEETFRNDINHLAGLIEPIQARPDAKAFMWQEEDRIVVRFKVPTTYAEIFENPQPVQDLASANDDDADSARASKPARSAGPEPSGADDQQDPGVFEDDLNRDFLRDFVSKRKAVKTKAASLPLSAGEVPSSPFDWKKLAEVRTNTPFFSANVNETPALPALAAAIPHTPERLGGDRSLVRPTPTFGLSSSIGEENSPHVGVETSHSRTRTPLGDLDANSPSPLKVKGGVGKRKQDDDETGREAKKAKENDHGRERTPDASSPKGRRALRPRKPVSAPATPAPASARVVRNGAKDLAAVTRANTRANKGNSLQPEEVLAGFAADPAGQKWKERKEVIDAKAARGRSVGTQTKSVRWAKELAAFQALASDDQNDDGDNDDEEKTDAADAPPPPPPADEGVSPAPIAKPKPKRGRPASAPPAAANPPKKGTQRSKLPAPVSRSVSPAAPSPSPKPRVRAKRAAAQKSNIGMGLTATGTPIAKAKKPRRG